MQLVIEIVVLGFMAPCLAGVCFGLGLHRGPSLSRLAAPMALLAACATGTLLLVWLPIVPQSHWQWLPIVVGLACLLGPLAELAPTRRWSARLGAAGMTALVAASLLVPDWASIVDTRLALAVGLGLACMLLSLATMVGVARASTRFSGLTFLACALAASILMFLADSAKFAQLGGLLVAGCLSWLIVAHIEVWHRLPLEGAVTAYGAGLNGLLFCGYLNSFSGVHWLCYGLIAVAPLGLLLTGKPTAESAEVALSLKSKLARWPWLAIATTSVPLIVAVGWALSVNLAEEW